MGKGLGVVQIKILECLRERPYFHEELINKTTGSNINNSIRSLQLRGYNLIRFEPLVTRCSGKKNRSLNVCIPIIYYYEKDKLKAYKMLMNMVGDRVYDHWISIGKPMLGDMIVHGKNGYKVIDDGNR